MKKKRTMTEKQIVAAVHRALLRRVLKRSRTSKGSAKPV